MPVEGRVPEEEEYLDTNETMVITIRIIQTLIANEQKNNDYLASDRKYGDFVHLGILITENCDDFQDIRRLYYSMKKRQHSFDTLKSFFRPTLIRV